MKATATIQAAHRASGLPGASPPAWSGYWTFVTATIIIMFVLFVAKKGTLGTWIGFLSWSAPKSLTAAPSDSAVSGTTGQSLGDKIMSLPWGQILNPQYPKNDPVTGKPQ